MSVPNLVQSEEWNGPLGRRWVTHQEALDRVWKPVGEATLARAAVRRDENVVDVGCGCGWTTLELASAVRPSGSVLGIDIAGPLLARASERARERGLSNVTFEQADASSRVFPGSADLVFSRMGVMFFEDPVAAFRNLRRALAPGGRLTFVSFRGKELNPWWTVPMGAAASVVPAPPPTTPYAPGPFSLSEEVRVRSVLDGAGFVDAVIEANDHDIEQGPDFESAAEFSISAGPAARLLVDATPETRERVRAAVARAFTAHARPSGEVVLRAATWIVRAKNPQA